MQVHDGVVELCGAVTPEVRDVAHAIAARTKGLKRVEDQIDILGRRRLASSR